MGVTVNRLDSLFIFLKKFLSPSLLFCFFLILCLARLGASISFFVDQLIHVIYFPRIFVFARLQDSQRIPKRRHNFQPVVIV